MSKQCLDVWNEPRHFQYNRCNEAVLSLRSLGARVTHSTGLIGFHLCFRFIHHTLQRTLSDNLGASMNYKEQAKVQHD